MAHRNQPAKRILRRALAAIAVLVTASLPLAALPLAALSVFSATAAVAARSAQRTEPPFATLAEEILAGLDASAAAGVRGDDPRVAVWPFSPLETPIPAALANEYNAKLLAALIDQGGDRYRFVARDALKAVAREISETAAAEDDIQEVLAVLVRNAQADVLVVGKLRPSSHERVVLSYKAVEVRDGTVLAVTSHQPLHLPRAEAQAAERAVTLNQAVLAAARHLASRAGDMGELRLGGLRHQDSGVQTPLARYLEERIAGALQIEFANPLTDTNLIVTRPEQAEDWPAGTYALKGGYWNFGRSIELQLSLRDAKGMVATWRERVGAESLPDGLQESLPDGLQDPSRVARSDPDEPGIAEPAPGTRVAASGPSSRQVVSVQEDLGALGYYPGPIDGVPGPRTRAAIRAYQRAAGLAGDGGVTEDFVDSLRRSRADGMFVARKAPAPRPDSSYRLSRVPPGYLPPPGLCRIWHRDRPPEYQPPPGSCAVLRHRVPPDARLIYGYGVYSEAPAPAPRGAEDDLIESFPGADLRRRMDRTDRRNAAGAYMRAYDVPIGRRVTWSNARSGNRGTVTPVRDGTSLSGEYCREFRQTVTIGGRTRRAYGVACQRLGGGWRTARQ